MEVPAKDIFQIDYKITPVPATTALMIIDMQYYFACPYYGLAAKLKARGQEGSLAYFFGQLPEVIKNISRLLEFFRQAKSEMIFVRIQSLTQDCREIGFVHKRLGTRIPLGSKEGEIIPELAPRENEIVISKTTTSLFNSSNADTVLRNLGIKTLVMTGVNTHACVESAVRDASDLGYEVILVKDGCAAFSQERHDNSLLVMQDAFAKVVSTDKLLACLKEGKTII